MRRAIARNPYGRTPIRANPAKQRVSASGRMLAPTGGWDTQQPLSDMDPDRAPRLDNFVPRERHVEIRRGTVQWASDFPAPVQTLISWRGPTSEKLFGAAGGSLYDITASGEAGSAVSSGHGNARWQWVNFTTPGGHFVRAVNGEDPSLVYDGSAWSTTPAITGVDSDALIGIFPHKQRLYFVEKNSTKFWYLAPLAIGGSAESYNLGSVWAKGGHIVAGGTWSIDGGDGPDDYAVFISSEGQVAVYSGLDPGDANYWALVGVYNLSRPIGRRCMIKLGGDLGILTEGGLLPLSQASRADPATNDKVAITGRINNAFQDAARRDRDNFGWEALLYERGELLIVNVPTTELRRADQYVMNSTTGAWCRWTSIPAVCWGIFQGSLYYGGPGGVAKADTGYLDLGIGITADMLGAWTTLRRPGQIKQFAMLRPIMRAGISARPKVEINVDFKETEPQDVPSITGGSVPVWGSAVWGLSTWGSLVTNRADWVGVAGIGIYGAPRVKASTEVLTSIEYELLLEEGGEPLLLAEDSTSLLLTEPTPTSPGTNAEALQVVGFDVLYQAGGVL